MRLIANVRRSIDFSIKRHRVTELQNVKDVMLFVLIGREEKVSLLLSRHVSINGFVM